MALLIGVAVGGAHHVPARVAATVITLAWLASCLCLTERAKAACTVAVLCGFLACGVAVGAVSQWAAMHTSLRAALVAARGAEAIQDDPGEPLMLTARLTSDAAVSESGVRVMLDAIDVEIDGRRLKTDGGIALTVTGEVDGAAARQWRGGRVLRLPAFLRRPARYLNPGVPDQERALARRGITLVGFAKSGLLVHVIERGSVAAELAARLRVWARDVLDTDVGRYSARSGAIVRAVILGDRAGLDAETEERLQQAGTYHVLAISGGNIAILAGLMFGIVRVLTARTGVAEMAVATILVGYAYLVGGGPSVVRATLMAVIFLLAHAIDQRSRPLNTLAVTAGVCLAVDPLMVYDAGAWLTYGATLGILVGAPLVLSRAAALPGLLRAALAVFAASLAAELALFPIGALVFSRVTAAGLLLNFAAIPLMTVVEVAGIAVLALAPVAPAASGAAALVAHWGAWGLVDSARLVDLMPWATTRLPPPDATAIVIYYGAWVVWFGARHARVRWPSASNWCLRMRAAGITAATAAAIWIVVSPPSRFGGAGLLRVTMIDVGQGDAALVRFPSGHAMLVDAGGAGGSRFDIGRRVVEPVIWALGVRRVTHLVVTHGDLDHAGGAPSLVRDLAPIEVWEGVPVPPHPLLRMLHELVQQNRGAWRMVQRGDRLQLGGVDVVAWHPPLPDWERQRVRNDDSVVIELRFGQVSIVLPGDIEVGGEALMAPLIPPVPIRVVQAPHHGSSSSSSWPWLRALAPSLAVVSVGRGNRYGHPHAAVLGRYRILGVPLLRTDQDGAISLETDGRSLVATTFSGKRLTIGSKTRPTVPPA